MGKGAGNQDAASGGREFDPVPAPMAVAAAIARGADRVLSGILAVVLCLILFYAGYAMWDNWRIYEGAGVDPSLLQYKPNLTGEGTGMGLSELIARNPDVRAWLTVEGTNIDYPVVQGEDNTRYLNTNVFGQFALSGSIFLDYRNAGDFADAYSLLYGHHMDRKMMFGQLNDFTNEAYFLEHDTAVLYTRDRVYRVEIFACMETDAYDVQLFSPGDFTQAAMEALLTRLRGEAVQFRDIGVTCGDRILAMSTCKEATGSGRTIVFGRMTELE